jgi:hypothetical protein
MKPEINFYGTPRYNKNMDMIYINIPKTIKKLVTPNKEHLIKLQEV